MISISSSAHILWLSASRHISLDPVSERTRPAQRGSTRSTRIHDDRRWVWIGVALNNIKVLSARSPFSIERARARVVLFCVTLIAHDRTVFANAFAPDTYLNKNINEQTNEWLICCAAWRCNSKTNDTPLQWHNQNTSNFPFVSWPIGNSIFSQMNEFRNGDSDVQNDALDCLVNTPQRTYSRFANLPHQWVQSIREPLPHSAIDSNSMWPLAVIRWHYALRQNHRFCLFFAFFVGIFFLFKTEFNSNTFYAVNVRMNECNAWSSVLAAGARARAFTLPVLLRKRS